MNRYREALGDYGEMWFQPASLLHSLVSAKSKLADFRQSAN